MLFIYTDIDIFSDITEKECDKDGYHDLWNGKHTLFGDKRGR